MAFRRTVERLAAAVGIAAFLAAAVPHSRGETAISFVRDVKPLLARRCFACHGPTANEGGLRLDDRDAALAELDSGLHAIVPGKAEDSALLDRIRAEDELERMPPEGDPLTAAEAAILESWIAQGAAWDKHWAFVPPQRRPLPTVRRDEWVRNPIDAFILAGLEKAGLEPADRADRRTLARRAYFDLTGLPPSMEQLNEFLSDEFPDAFDRLIDKLLASPRYGERWARHWLDLVRFAETNSYERDGVKPNAWKYRDYVIRSLNNDKPYDQFLREQLAGDELDVVTSDTMIATGYYRLGIWDDEPADREQAMFDEWDDIISTTSQAMLGLTVACARCHDHKIDPIPQADYYGLLAFFADVTQYGGPDRNVEKYSQWDMSTPDERKVRAELADRERQIRQEMTAMEEVGIKRMSASDQRRSETPERQELLGERLEGALNASEWELYAETRRRLRGVQRQIRRLPRPESALALARCNPHPGPTHIMVRGNPHVPGDEVQPHFPALFGDSTPRIARAPQGARSAGRRRILADWIASPDNMLTARVIVNRVWQHHFGRGIVRSASNFGALGTPPTHPELLDWLALRLVDNNWRLKPLHRLIMGSAAYQMSSAGDERALALDPTNDLFWRFDMRRLGAEEIRDATLATTGQLNGKLYGPGFYLKLPEEVLHTQSMPGSGWGESPDDQTRRSIYIHVKRSLLPPLLTAFDFPDVDISCEGRFNTTQPGQALAMLNGDFFHEQAGKLADRVVAEAPNSVRDQVAKAVQLALNRPAREDEIAAGLALIQRLSHEHNQPPDEALRYWCLTVLNLNEYIYLD